MLVTVKHSRILLGEEDCGNGGLALQEWGTGLSLYIHEAASENAAGNGIRTGVC